jgi:hypothetical protein
MQEYAIRSERLGDGGGSAGDVQPAVDVFQVGAHGCLRYTNSPPHEPYAQLRRAFVYKDKPPRTPPHLARHRTHPWPARPGETRAPQAARIATR